MFFIGLLFSIILGNIFQFLRKGKDFTKKDFIFGTIYTIIAWCFGYFILTNLTEQSGYYQKIIHLK